LSNIGATIIPTRSAVMRF